MTGLANFATIAYHVSGQIEYISEVVRGWEWELTWLDKYLHIDSCVLATVLLLY